MRPLPSWTQGQWVVTCCDYGLGLAAHTNMIQYGWFSPNTYKNDQTWILGFIATPLWSHMEPYTSIHNFLLCRRSFSHTTVSPPWQVRAIDPSRGGLSGAKPAGLKSKSLPYLPLDPLDPASCEASPLDLALLAWASLLLRAQEWSTAAVIKRRINEWHEHNRTLQ